MLIAAKRIEAGKDKEMETAIYKLGKVYIEIQKPEGMRTPKNLEKFRVEQPENNAVIQMRYFLEYTELILEKQEILWAKKVPGKEALRETLHVFQTTEGECRRINLHGVSVPYAITLTKPEGTCQIWINEQYKEWMQLDTVFIAMLALEKQMIDADAMILHSAYMCYENMAVLFSAPSETGKSTQANLWEQYRGTRTINGDRSLLLREEDGWRAYGWPVCGSSEICHDESYPVRAIVMLKQAKENKCYPLTGFQAVREVMEQITVNAWDSDFQIKVMDNLDQLLREVPIYRLECDISEAAVKCLEDALKGAVK